MRRKDYTLSGLKVGIVVFTSLIILIVVVFLLGRRGGVFSTYYELRARFPKVNGLVIGSPVWLSGVSVGYVSDIRFPEKLQSKELVVVMKIKTRYKKYIREDSRAYIETKGLLGNKIITITIGSSGKRILQNGDFIKTVPPLDITEFVSGATASLRNLQQIIEDLKDIGNAIRAGKGSLGLLVNDNRLYAELTSILANLDRFSRLLNKADSSLGKFMRSSELYDNINGVVLDVKNGRGTMGQLLHNQKPFDKINEILERLDRIIAYIESGKGNMGRLVKEEQFYNNMNDTLNETRETLKEIKALIQDIKKNPQRYFRVKVF